MEFWIFVGVAVVAAVVIQVVRNRYGAEEEQVDLSTDARHRIDMERHMDEMRSED